MRYRALSPTGDYLFGNGQADFLINSPECVAQAIKTRLELFLGEWFLNLAAGMPWLQDVVGFSSGYDQVIRQQILLTPGVTSIGSYSSSVSVDRKLTVDVQDVATIYGTIPALNFAFASSSGVVA